MELATKSARETSRHLLRVLARASSQLELGKVGQSGRRICVMDLNEPHREPVYRDPRTVGTDNEPIAPMDRSRHEEH